MESGLSAVHAVLGFSTPISDRDIRDALWNSYFDVDGSIAFLLGTPESGAKGCMN
jgi:elongation factor 1 alpha-like protein